MKPSKQLSCYGFIDPNVFDDDFFLEIYEMCSNKKMAQDDLIRIRVAVNDVIKIYEQIIDLVLVLQEMV